MSTEQAKRTVYETYESQAAIIETCPPGGVVAGLVQSPAYFREHFERILTPDEVETTLAKRATRQEVFFGHGGKLHLYVGKKSLQRALRIPEQREMMLARRDSGQLEVGALYDDDPDLHVNTWVGATSYQNNNGEPFAGYMEVSPEMRPDGARDEDENDGGIFGTIDTKEGRRVVKVASGRMQILSEQSEDVTSQLDRL